MLVYRIQPTGLELDHYSEDSAGQCRSLHVFDSPLAAIYCAESPLVYGDEVVEIETESSWDNGDVEGVAINPKRSRIVRRWPLDEFAKEFFPGLEAGDVTYAYRDLPYWFTVRNRKG